MNDIIDVQTNDEKAEGLKAWGWVSYVLHLIVAVGAVIPCAQPGPAADRRHHASRAQPGAGPPTTALTIDLEKQGEGAGTWQASHFSWRTRTVIWAGVLYIITAPLWLLFFFPGWVAWGLISIWFLYRIVRGMVTMNKSQAIDA